MKDFPPQLLEMMEWYHQEMMKQYQVQFRQQLTASPDKSPTSTVNVFNMSTIAPKPALPHETTPTRFVNEPFLMSS